MMRRAAKRPVGLVLVMSMAAIAGCSAGGDDSAASGSGGSGGSSSGSGGSGGSIYPGSGGSGGDTTGSGGSGGGGHMRDAGRGDGGGGKKRLGSDCTADADCRSGLMCDLSTPGGMCTLACAADATCTDGRTTGVCIAGMCHASCDPASDAGAICKRKGYLCTGDPGHMGCTPNPDAGSTPEPDAEPPADDGGQPSTDDASTD